MTRIGIVTGLKSEIEALAGVEGAEFFAAGGSAARAANAARRMAARGARALASVGLAGGLDLALGPGAVVLATQIVDGAGRTWSVDPKWRASMARALDAASIAFAEGAVVGSDCPVATTAGKAALRARAGAVAVDMESHGVAAAAQEAGIPFVAVRVIADPAEERIPRPALAGMASDGSVRPGAVLRRLALRPWETMAVLRLARASKAAHAALGRIAASGGLRLPVV